MINKDAVTIDQLVVHRGRRPVLHDLSLSVRRGSVTGLLGPSGCGKTTLIRCIAGIQKIHSGRITVFDDTAGTRANRRRVGYVTQSDSVYPDLTVRQNLRYFAALSGSDSSAIDRALGDVGLRGSADDLVGALSGGQRNRVSLAAALLAEPDLYLLDEPTVGLDPVLRRDLWELFIDRARAGATLLVSSHVMDEAARCDDILLLRDGRLLAASTPDGLRAAGGHDDLESAFLALAEENPS